MKSTQGVSPLKRLSLVLVVFLAHQVALSAADCNGNGVEDAQEIGADRSLDCNSNGVPDECDTAPSFDFGLVELPDIPSPTTLELVDVNDDGVLDLVVLDFSGVLGGTETVTVLLGKGDGGFEEGNRFSVGIGAGMLISADLNDDGLVDLATPNIDSHDVSVLFSVGDGTFESEIRMPVGEGPRTLAASDLNGDGLVDLVTWNVGPDEVSVLLNLGGRNFDVVSFSAGGRPTVSIVTDLNGDGVPDLATAVDAEEAAVSLLYGVGDGSFEAARRLGPGRLFPASLIAADLNTDGLLDLYVGHSASNEGSVFLGREDGEFEDERRLAFPSGRTFHSVDFDGSVFRAMDLNGDGVIDLFSSTDSGLSVFIGVGDGSFEDEMYYAVGDGLAEARIIDLVPTDLDGDGIVDFAATFFDAEIISVLRGVGDGRFRGEKRIAFAGSKATRAVAGDRDGDGLDDLVTADFLTGKVAVLINQTTPPVSTDADGDSIPDECQSGPKEFLRGDVNADGTPNIADGVSTLLFLFAGAAEPSCLKSVDSNDDGEVNVTDALYLLNFLFSGGPDPADPFGECGRDATEDGLTCRAYSRCE